MNNRQDCKNPNKIRQQLLWSGLIQQIRIAFKLWLDNTESVLCAVDIHTDF